MLAAECPNYRKTEVKTKYNITGLKSLQNRAEIGQPHIEPHCYRVE